MVYTIITQRIPFYCFQAHFRMTKLEIILAVLTAMSGLGNLTQWVNLRAIRQKADFEADNAHIDNLKSVIDLQADEIKRLQERVKELEDKQREREASFESRINDLEAKLKEYGSK